MQDLILIAEQRTQFGSIAARKYRKAGLIPSTLLDKASPPQHILLKKSDVLLIIGHKIKFATLKYQDNQYRVFIIDVQMDHLGREPYQVDLKKVSPGEYVPLKLKITFSGEPVGVKRDAGVFESYLDEVKALVSVPPSGCAPIESIKVDVSDLQLGQALAIRDISLTPEVKAILLDPGTRIARVIKPQIKEEKPAQEISAPAVSAPEVIKKKKEISG